ncbi:cryptochrome/photolyase family protein [Microbacterium sp.]|uniref:cryptochrome/photolyase family protein n=1 Tax=Microbacterium sp. TaxID=51671 RepID=UPI003A943EEE
MTTLVWFRDDLRLADNPALSAGREDADGMVCLYVYDDESPGIRPPGEAAQWWLHYSLRSLATSLAEWGVPLVLRRGAARTVVREVVSEVGVDAVVWNRRYGGAERELDAGLKRVLRDDGIDAQSFPGNMLHEPWTIQTSGGTPFQVYSAFWRACLRMPEPRHPLSTPETLAAATKQPRSDDLDSWGLLPRDPNWASEFAQRWTPGEKSAIETLKSFLAERVEGYADDRDMLALPATSGLSPHLRWGEISPHTIWHRARATKGDVEGFLGELGWREFAWYTLFHRPGVAEENIDRRFDGFEWAKPEQELLDAWRRGRTGFPVVDAGMRELWRTGTMHNRARMITASFLTKNLLLDWRIGERWFWNTLVDADAANNSFNWQWVAGCGTDAAPYFRVFNPLLQQKKFDPRGTYVQYWAPDSEKLEPIVDLKETRRRALAAFDAIKNDRPETKKLTTPAETDRQVAPGT